MIDLHSHIVPGFDDGARSMEDALEMARMAADSGVTILAATSHGDFSQGDPGACLRDYRKRLAVLRREIRTAGIRLKLAGGMEILLTGETLRYAERHRLPGLRGGNWILAEFVFDIPQARARRRLEFLDRQGYQVILAHPERYDFVQRDPGCLREIAGERLLLQVNKGSLLGDFGGRAGRTADWILSRGLAGLIASDAHDPVLRTPDLREVRELVELKYGRKAALDLLWRTPARILKDRGSEQR